MGRSLSRVLKNYRTKANSADVRKEGAAAKIRRHGGRLNATARPCRGDTAAVFLRCNRRRHGARYRPPLDIRQLADQRVLSQIAQRRVLTALNNNGGAFFAYGATRHRCTRK